MDDIPLLLGVTNEGKYVSLIDCSVMRATGISGLTKTTQEIKPRLIAYNVHFTSVEDFRLRSLSMRYSNLDQWVDTSGFTVTLSPAQPYSVSVQYAKPEPIKTTLSNGLTVGVLFSAAGPDFGRSRSEIHIQQKAWLDISASDERPYDELLRATATVVDLISLAVGQPMRPIECQATASDSASTDNPKQSIRFDLIHNAKTSAPILTDVETYKMLFSLEDLRSNFGPILEAWVFNMKTLSPSTACISVHFEVRRCMWSTGS
jgi:hypothetical protein